jgi:hypothetical protein
MYLVIKLNPESKTLTWDGYSIHINATLKNILRTATDAQFMEFDNSSPYDCKHDHIIVLFDLMTYIFFFSIPENILWS